MLVIQGMNFVLMPSCSLFQLRYDKHCAQQKGHRAQSFGISQVLRVNQLEDVGISTVGFFLTRIPQMCPEKDRKFPWVSIISHRSGHLHSGVQRQS